MPDIRRHSRRLRQMAPLLLAALFALLLAGCGKKGALTLRSWEPPRTPLDVKAVHREDSITLLWAFPAGEQTMLSGFRVTRDSSAGPSREFNIPPGERSFTDRDFRTGETYRYHLIAVSSAGIPGAAPAAASAKPLQPPPAPGGLTAAVRGNAVVLSWHGAPGQFFNVYRRRGEAAYGMWPVNASPLNTPAFTDSLDLQSPVRYAVRALLGTDIRDEGPLSQEVAMDPAELTPPAPRNPAWRAVSGSIVLSWDDGEESWARGFRIYRRTPGGAFVRVGETQLPYFLDSDTPAGPRDYRVTALGPVKEGPPAELTGISPAPPDPN